MAMPSNKKKKSLLCFNPMPITYGPDDLFVVFDVLLALVIFYHGANGLRLALNEMGMWLKAQAKSISP